MKKILICILLTLIVMTTFISCDKETITTIIDDPRCVKIETFMADPDSDISKKAINNEDGYYLEYVTSYKYDLFYTSVYTNLGREISIYLYNDYISFITSKKIDNSLECEKPKSENVKNDEKPNSENSNNDKKSNSSNTSSNSSSGLVYQYGFNTTTGKYGYGWGTSPGINILG